VEARFGAAVLAAPQPSKLDALNRAADRRDPTKALVEIGTTRHVERIEKLRLVRLKQRDSAARMLHPLPVKGESLHGLLDGSFAGFHLCEATIKLLAPAVISELCIATLSFSRGNIHSLLSLLDSGRVARCLFLGSIYFASTSAPEWDLLRDSLLKRRQSVGASRNHAKVMCIASGEHRFVFEGSMNLRSCSALEQFCLCDSRPLYDFHRSWIQQLVQEAGA
jgi:hypothetical protein